MSAKLKIFVFTVFIFIVVLFFIIIIFSVNTSKKTGPKESPAPTLAMPKNAGAEPGQQAPSLSEEELNRRSFAVSTLIDKLPYFGKNFTLSYSFSGAKFILYVNPKNQTQGYNEFDLFLKQNGIDSRSWIDNLFVTYISPTPTP